MPTGSIKARQIMKNNTIVKSKDKYYYLVDLVVILAGLAITFSADSIDLEAGNKWYSILQNIGTGLFAAGIVSIVLRYFSPWKQKEVARNLKVVAKRGKDYEKEFINRKFHAEESIKIMSIALVGAMKDFSEYDDLIRKIISQRVHVKLMFLNPLAEYIKDRAKADGNPIDIVLANIKSSIARSKKVHEKLEISYQSSLSGGSYDRSVFGSFEIRLFNTCPYFSLYIIDNMPILWGVYSAAGLGYNQPVIEVPNEQAIIYNSLLKNFDRLWDWNSDNYLVKFDWTSGGPKINNKILSEIYGHNWKTELDQEIY